MAQAIEAFQEECEKTDHQYQQMLQQNINNVSKILARANQAYAKENLAEIESIIEHVDDMESASD